MKRIMCCALVMCLGLVTGLIAGFMLIEWLFGA